MEAPSPIAKYPFKPYFRPHIPRNLRLGNFIAGGLVITCLLGTLFYVVIRIMDAIAGSEPSSPTLKAIGIWIMVGSLIAIVAIILFSPSVTEFEAGLKRQYEDEVASWRGKNDSPQWRVERPSWDAGGNLMIDLIRPNSITRIDRVCIPGSRYRISLVLAPAGTTETTLRFDDVWYRCPSNDDRQYQAEICFGGAVIITTPDLEAFQFSAAVVPANSGHNAPGPDGTKQFIEYLKP